MNEDITRIYVLIDPRDNEIRYVGMTTKQPEERLKRHLRETICQGHRRHWLDKLKRIRLCPSIQVIQEVPSSFGGQAERYWIAYFRSVGCNLVNDTDGGEGQSGYKRTPEQIARISANAKRQMQDPEQRRKVSEVHKGKTISVENRRAISVATTKRWEEWRANGAYTSPETRAKISASKQGKNNMSPEHQQRFTMSQRGKPKSPEHRAKIAESNRRTKAAKRAQCQPSI